MTDFLPESVREQLQAARRKADARKSRLRVTIGEESYPIIRLGSTGFSVFLEDAPRLRGLVDVYDGARQVAQCLIVAAEEEGDLMRYEFKRNTATGDGVPLDYVRAEDAPIALLPR